jgi:hypothetical protein
MNVRGEKSKTFKMRRKRTSANVLVAIGIAILILLPWLVGSVDTVASEQNDANSGGDAGNTFADATLISPGTYEGWIGSGDRKDWYKFSVNNGQMINVDLNPSLGSNFDLKLYAPSESVRATSEHEGSSAEYVSYVADSSDEWRVKIYIKSGSGNYSFSLSITYQNDADSGGDAGNKFKTATPISVNKTYSGFLMPSDTQDWYKFNVTSLEGYINVELTPPVGVNFDLKLFNRKGTEKAFSSYSAGKEYISFYPDSTGEWRIQILGGSGKYVFNVSTSSLSSKQNAENGGDAGDNFDEAELITSGYYNGSLQSKKDVDWYRFSVEASQVIEVGVTSWHTSFYIYDPDKKTKVHEDIYYMGSVSFIVKSEGQWRIRFDSDSPVSYSFILTIRNQNDAETGLDAGDTHEDALLITPGIYTGYLLPADKEDWFKFSVDIGQVIEVGLSKEGYWETKLSIYDSYGNKMMGEGELGGRMYASWVANSSGEWRIRVSSSEGGLYSFILTVFPPDITKPSLTITSPSNASLLSSFFVTVKGTASDNAGLKRVEISTDNSSWVISDGTTLWSGNLTLVEHNNTIYARAIDFSGNVKYTWISVIVDTTVPSLFIISPEDGATIEGTVDVLVRASDENGIQKVECYIDDSLLFASSIKPYSFSWDTTTVENGQYTIKAIAYDKVGNSQEEQITLTVDNPAPIAVEFYVAFVLMAFGVGVIAILLVRTMLKKKTLSKH